MRYDTVLFDLDGTLADSAPGITGTMQKTLRQFGIEENQTALRRYLGPPLREMFGDYLPAKQVEEAVALYRKFYHEDGIFNAALYPGIPELLKGLKEAGDTICLATAKPKEAAVLVLGHFDIARYFDVMGGAQEERGIFNKTDVLRDLLHCTGAAPEQVVLVGDRQDDMRGAANCGIDAIGVAYGYAKPGELEAFSPVLLAKDTGELLSFLR